MSINANANVTGVSNGEGSYNYTITLNDTGSTTIGTFWFGWIPGQFFLSQDPSSIGSPTGWSEQIVAFGGGYSIEWTANSSGSYIQPSGSSSSFTFSSTETPTQLAANSPLASSTPSTTSYVYAGAPFATSGQQITPAVTLVENAAATITPQQISPGEFQYTIALTDTGNTPVATFWFAWDDVPDQDFMSAQPTNIASPTGWTNTVTTHSYSIGTGYGIMWTATTSSADLASNQISSSFTFDSTETPAQLAAVSPFNDPDNPTVFQDTSSFVYSGVAEETPGGNFVVEVACFREGTRISTPTDPAAIEALRPGDLVMTAAGEALPVRWTGRRRVVCHRHPYPERIWPVRVARGALGSEIPCVDLYLSPDHALFLDGVLVPVKYLVNGTTITRVPTDVVTWHHLELDKHEVILAEGAPAETYLDTGDRAKFAGEVTRLFPDAGMRGRARTVREAWAGMEFVVTGPVLAAIRHRLGERARLLAGYLPGERAA